MIFNDVYLVLCVVLTSHNEVSKRHIHLFIVSPCGLVVSGSGLILNQLGLTLGHISTSESSQVLYIGHLVIGNDLLYGFIYNIHCSVL